MIFNVLQPVEDSRMETHWVLELDGHNPSSATNISAKNLEIFLVEKAPLLLGYVIEIR